MSPVIHQVYGLQNPYRPCHRRIKVRLHLIFRNNIALTSIRGIGLAVTRLLLSKFHANVVAISRSSTPELEALKSSALLHIQCDMLVYA